MTEGLAVIDDEGRIAYCNQSAESLFMFTPEETQGKSFIEALGLKAPDFETQRTLESLQDLLKDGITGPASLELVMLRPEMCQLLMTVFPIIDSPGSPMSGLIVRDVTQERELERRRDSFVSVASHELRTPMTTILGYAELLLDRDPPKATRQEWIGSIHRDANRLAVIVNDLLDVSRIQSGKLSVNPEEIALHSLVDEEVNNIRSSTDKHEFQVDIPHDLPNVIADRHKLTQVLANLLGNATKYSPGGGQITVSAYYECERQRVVTAISDQGIGIDPDDQEELFTTFHRIPRPETESTGGSGLGLFIVKGLVNLMNGEVWLKSEMGQGATFLFSTPTVEQPMREKLMIGYEETFPEIAGPGI